MSKYRGLLLIVCSISICIAQTTIAVIDFDARGISQSEVSTLTDRLRDELIKTGKYNVIERGQMEEVLKEQGLQQTGCVSDECVVEVGQLMGVQQMVGGSIGNVFSVSARIIDVQSGEIANVTTFDYKGDVGNLLTTGMRQVVTNLLSEVEIAVVETTEVDKPVSSGSCYIDTNPFGADVWIDDIKLEGVTPLLIDSIDVGEHIIYAEKGDTVASNPEAFNILNDDLLKVDLVLRRGKGTLKIVTTPFEATAFLNGKKRGLTPLLLKELKSGKYNLSIKKEGFDVIEQKVIIRNNKIEEIVAELEVLATLSITSAPGNADVSIDGEHRGKTPLQIQLSKGQHEIGIAKINYKIHFENVGLVAGEITTKHFELNYKTGSLTINSNPPDADVFIDSKPSGKSPLLLDILSIGNHSVVVKKEGYITDKTNVQIEADKSDVINFELITVDSVKKQILSVKRKKFIGFSTATGAAVVGGLFSYLANSNYNSYSTATHNASDLHNKIDQQALVAKSAFGVSAVGLIVYFNYSDKHNKLEQQLIK